MTTREYLDAIERRAKLESVCLGQNMTIERLVQGLRLAMEALEPFAAAAKELEHDEVVGDVRYGRRFIPVLARDYFNAQKALAALDVLGEEGEK